MLPGLSTVLRRDKERQRAAGSTEGSPAGIAYSPPSMPMRRDDSAGALPHSPPPSQPNFRRPMAPQQAGTAGQAQSPPQGPRGPGLLPEEHRARERERERMARAQLSNAHTAQMMANRQMQQTMASTPSQAGDPTTQARYSSSHMESSVTRLLVATKMLLEALTKWSLGQRTESQVSDIYVRLGNDFNVANVAFGSYGIDMSDLASVPDDLRDCLERCLSEDASPQTLEIHLPRIREIIISLLQGLKGKQAEYKQLLMHRRASARSSKSRAERTNQSSEGARSSISQTPSLANASTVATETQQSGTVKESQTSAPAAFGVDVRRSIVGKRPLNAPPIEDSSAALSQRPGSVTSARQSDLTRASQRRSRRDTEEQSVDLFAERIEDGTGLFSSGPSAMHETDSTEAALGLVSSDEPRGVQDSQTMSTFNGHQDSGEAAVGEIGDAADPSVRALKSRDALERRASKRFSAYTFNKMGVGLNQGLGMSSYALPGTGSAMSSPAVERSTTGTPSRGSVKRGTGRSSSELQNLETPSKTPLRDRGTPMTDTIMEAADPPLRKKGSRTSPRHSPRPSQTSLAPPLPMMKEQANSSTESLPFVDAQSPTKETSEMESEGVRSSGSSPASVPPVPPLPSPKEQARLAAAHSSKTATGSRWTSGSRTPTASSHGFASSAQPTSMYLYLQLGRQTKRVVLELDPMAPLKGLSTGKLRMLFMDKFSYSPGKEDFPTIYVKDAHSGVSYELEDLTELADGTVLTLNIEPLDQMKQHLDLTLGGLTRELRDLKATIHDRDREWNRRLSAQHSDGLAPPLSPQSRISDAQFAMAGARVAHFKRATMLFGQDKVPDKETHEQEEALVPADAESLLRPKSSGWQVAGDQLKKQYEEVLNVRRQLAVMGQIHEDFKGEVGSLLGGLRKQAKRVRAIAATEVPTERNFIIAGKARLDSNSQEILTLVEDLLDLVDDLKADVIQRGVKPKPHTMKKLGDDIDRATRGLEDLSKYVDLVKPSWKKTWEMELQNIVDEQEFLNHQEGLIADLKEDHANLQDVFHNIQEVVKLRGANRFNLMGNGAGGENALSNVSLRTYIPPPPEEGHEGLPTVMMEVKSQSVDHDKRLKALEAAEKQRLKELRQRKLQEDGFQHELTTFVDGKALRKTGGYLETERVRGRRDKLTLQAMFGAGGVGGAPVDVGPPSKRSTAGGEGGARSFSSDSSSTDAHLTGSVSGDPNRAGLASAENGTRSDPIDRIVEEDEAEEN